MLEAIGEYQHVVPSSKLKTCQFFLKNLALVDIFNIFNSKALEYYVTILFFFGVLTVHGHAAKKLRPPLNTTWDFFWNLQIFIGWHSRHPFFWFKFGTPLPK